VLSLLLLLPGLPNLNTSPWSQSTTLPSSASQKDVVALDDKAESVQRMRQNYNIALPVAIMPAMAQLPIDFGIITNRWSGQIPALALIRPGGEVALIKIGCCSSDRIDKMIADELQNK
jgi:hypothetical protein